MGRSRRGARGGFAAAARVAPGGDGLPGRVRCGRGRRGDRPRRHVHTGLLARGLPPHGTAPVPAGMGDARLLLPRLGRRGGGRRPAPGGGACAGARPGVSVSGDGGFLFACGELATVAQERLPLTTVIVDDARYGMLRYDQRRSGAETYGVDLRTPDFVALAESFGVPAEAVDGLEGAFSAALARHVADPEPSVLVARAAPEPPPTTSPRWYRPAA